MNLPTLKCNYRIIQLGVNSFMIQRRWFGLFWIDDLYQDQWSKERCLELLERWAADRAARGRIVWP